MSINQSGPQGLRTKETDSHILHTQCMSIVLFDKELLKKSVKHAAKLLKKAPTGVAIASTQAHIYHAGEINDTKEGAIPSFFIYKDKVYYDPTYRVNPTLGVQIKSLEVCLSDLSTEYMVDRWTSIVMEYIDEQGLNKYVTWSGVDAIVAQHEIDHLNGRCLWDHGSIEHMKHISPITK